MKRFFALLLFVSGCSAPQPTSPHVAASPAPPAPAAEPSSPAPAQPAVPPEPAAPQLQQPATRPGQLQPGEGFVLVSWDQTERFIDRPALVYGRIVSANNNSRGTRCFLNFHQDWRTHFSASIDAKLFSAFPQAPEAYFDDKRVLLKGIIDGELSKPEMTITSADQITLIPDNASDIVAFARQQFPGAATPDQIKTAAARPTDTIRIGTYNVLNLFDEFDDPYREDERMEPKPRTELENLAQTIRQLDADVLALQEVENRFYLEQYVRSFLPEMGYNYVELIEANNHRGIDCAIVSRLPIKSATTHRHLSFKGPDGKMNRFQRDLLQVRLEGPGEFEFDVFVVHLKSKYGDTAGESEPTRLAEAAKVREIVDHILYQDPNARFVICGDFNDTWDSPSIKLIRGSGQTELICPGASLPELDRVTYNKAPFISMIDYIMCSPAMHRCYVESSYRMIPGTVDGSGSDHNPSVATFRVR